jgi:hypothetical protein
MEPRDTVLARLKAELERENEGQPLRYGCAVFPGQLVIPAVEEFRARGAIRAEIEGSPSHVVVEWDRRIPTSSIAVVIRKYDGVRCNRHKRVS